MNRNKAWGSVAFAALLALIALCVLWELWLVPLNGAGGIMAIKAVPLLFAVRGAARRNPYTLQWLSMLVLLYFTEGIVDATTDIGLPELLGVIETALSLLLFAAILFYLGPIKKARRAALKGDA